MESKDLCRSEFEDYIQREHRLSVEMWKDVYRLIQVQSMWDGWQGCWEFKQITTVDLASADASGYRNGRASVVVELPDRFDPNGGGDWAMWEDLVIKAIIAAGGSVKE